MKDFLKVILGCAVLFLFAAGSNATEQPQNKTIKTVTVTYTGDIQGKLRPASV